MATVPNSLYEQLASGGAAPPSKLPPSMAQQWQERRISKAKADDEEATRNRALNDHKILNDTFLSSGGDFKVWRQKAIQAGVSPGAWMTVEKFNTEQNKELADAFKANSDAAFRDVEAKQKKAEMLSQNMTAYLDLPDDQRTATAPQVQQWLIQQGVLKPDQPFDDTTAQFYRTAGLSEKDRLEQAKQRAAQDEAKWKHAGELLDFKKKAADTAKAEADTQQTLLENKGELPESAAQRNIRLNQERIDRDRIEDNKRQQQRVDDQFRHELAMEGRAAAGGTATRGQFLTVKTAKDRALRDSQTNLDGDLVRIDKEFKSEAQDLVSDPKALQALKEQHDADVRRANLAHLRRMQQAQLDYEAGSTELSGNDVEHNDWADQLVDEFNGVRRNAQQSIGQATQQASPTAPAKPKKGDIRYSPTLGYDVMFMGGANVKENWKKAR